MSLAGLHAVVVGAGFGGLAAAAHLAARGARVTVLERASYVGGKAAPREVDGFSFDTGPTLLTMPDVMREAFRAAGASLDELCPLTRLAPVARYVFADGRTLSIHDDPERTAREIARIDQADARAWGPFLEDAKRIWEVAGEPYLEAPFEGYAAFTGRVLERGARAVRIGAGLSTLDAIARRHFRSREMRMLVGRFATYAGGAPKQSTGAYAMIAHLEISVGAFYPRGGMHALAAAFGRALERRGVAIRTSTPVERVIFDGDRVTGVRTADGAVVAADVVVCDVDPLVVLEQLLPRALAERGGLSALRRREPSLSGFAWCFGVEGEVPRDAHHTVLFGRDYDDEFDAIFRRKSVCDDPTVYASVASLSDPARAPAGCHAVFTLINAPATGDDRAWEGELRDRLRERILSRLERYFSPDLRRRIRAEAFVTPRDIAKTGAAGGAIYGAAPHGATASFDRPRNRADFARGLYFAGGVPHPGGGVPMVTLGGRFVAELIQRDAARLACSPSRSRFGRFAG